MATLDPIDFPQGPVDGQIHKEKNETYVYQAAGDFWLGGQAGQVYLLNKANQGFLSSFYLGAHDKANAPATMQDGSPLKDFVLYFDTTLNTMRMWHGAPVSEWKSLITPVPAERKIYTYIADGASKDFSGADVNGQSFTLDPANKETVLVFNGSYLTLSTTTHAADYSVDYINSVIKLTAIPRKGTEINIHVLTADDSKNNKDPLIFHIKNTKTAKAFTGALPNDKLLKAIAPVKPQIGMAVIVSHDPAVGADNSYEGIWYYDGTFKNVFSGGSATGGSRVFQTTARILDNRKGALSQADQILDSQFVSIFSTPPQDGDWVVVPLVQGALSKFSGLFVRDPATHKFIPAATSYSTKYIEGFVKTTLNRLNDIDITTQGIPEGSIQAITTTNDKELMVATDAGSWVSIYSEREMHRVAAQASLWQSAIAKAQLGSLPTPAAGNKGQYWTWLGVPDVIDPTKNVGGQIVDNTFAKIHPDLDGEKLQIGDWIQSDGTKWVHVPADLLNKSRWESLGSFKTWSAVAWEKGSLIKFKPTYADGSTASKWHFYQANADVKATDPDPNTGGMWDDITPSFRPHELDGVTPKATLEDKDILIYDDTSKAWTVSKLPASGILDWDPAKTYVDVGSVVLRSSLGTGDTNWTPNSVATLYRSISNVADNLNKDPLDPLVGINFWEKVVFLQIDDLEKVNIRSVKDHHGLFWNETDNEWQDQYVNDKLQWEDRDYAVTELVFNKGKLYRPNKAITAGSAEPSATNADWDIVGGAENFDELKDVDTTGVVNNQVVAYNGVSATWEVKDIGALSAWVDKDYLVGTMVYDSTSNMIWISNAAVTTGDDGPALASIGTTGYKWDLLDTLYKPSVWTGVKQEVANTFVIRKANGGADPYTGPATLFLCLTNTNTDPLVDKTNYLPLGSNAKSGSSIEKYNNGITYKANTFVYKDYIVYRALKDLDAGFDPDAKPTVVPAGGDTGTAALGIADLETITPTLGLTVGSYTKVDIGKASEVISKGLLKGMAITEQTGWLMVIDSSLNANKGYSGYWFIPDSTGTNVGNPANTPQANIDIGNGWERITISSVGDLADVDITTTAPTDGQSLVWKDADKKFVPSDIYSPIVFIGEGKFVPANLASKADNYGMPATGVYPDPQVWTPAAGDQYFDLSTGTVTVFTGTLTKRRGSIGSVTGTTSVSNIKLGELTDVDTTGAVKHAVLTYNSVEHKWKPEVPASAQLPIFPYDNAVNYLAGNMVEEGNKLYVASRPVTGHSPTAGNKIERISFNAGAGDTAIPVNQAELNNWSKPHAKGTWYQVTIAGAFTPTGGPFDGVAFTGGEHMLIGDTGLTWAMRPYNNGVTMDVQDPNPWVLVGEPNAPAANVYTKAEADALFKTITSSDARDKNIEDTIGALATGIAHGLAIKGVLNTPPANPPQGEIWIVGTNPDDGSAFDPNSNNEHANKVAWHDGANWHFDAPEVNEAHLNEPDNHILHWNGSQWNSIGTAGINPLPTGTRGQILVNDGAGNWVSQDQAPSSLIYHKEANGDHSFGLVDTHAFTTELNKVYLLSCSYRATWAHNTNYINFQIKHGATDLAVSGASAGLYGTRETIQTFFTGTGNIETFNLNMSGSGGTLERYSWYIQGF